MIQVTRLNRTPLVLNSDLIEYIESTPDTVITLTTGQKIVVSEPSAEVVKRIVAFRKMLLEGVSLFAVPALRAQRADREGVGERGVLALTEEDHAG